MSNEATRAPSRMAQRHPVKTKHSLTTFLMSMFCCCWVRDGYDNHTSRVERSNRADLDPAARPPGPPPPRTSSRGVPGPPRPRRPSQYELDEQKAMRRGIEEQQAIRRDRERQARQLPIVSPAKGGASVPRGETPPSVPRGSRQHLKPIVTDSPTARIVPRSSSCGFPTFVEEPEQEKQPQSSSASAATLKQESVEEQVQQHKHLAKLRAVQSQSQKNSPELPVNEGASMYNEAPTSPRSPDFAGFSAPEYNGPPPSPVSGGFHIGRDQHRYDALRAAQGRDQHRYDALRAAALTEPPERSSWGSSHSSHFGDHDFDRRAPPPSPVSSFTAFPDQVQGHPDPLAAADIDGFGFRHLERDQQQSFDDIGELETTPSPPPRTSSAVPDQGRVSSITSRLEALKRGEGTS